MNDGDRAVTRSLATSSAAGVGRCETQANVEVGARPRSPAAEHARLNAVVAIELDVVGRRERVADYRLAGRGVLLAPSLVVAEALMAGIGVRATCLDVEWRAALRLRVTIVLDEALALAVALVLPVVAAGPLEQSGV